jgi:hypothetical protein
LYQEAKPFVLPEAHLVSGQSRTSAPDEGGAGDE